MSKLVKGLTDLSVSGMKFLRDETEERQHKTVTPSTEREARSQRTAQSTPCHQPVLFFFRCVLPATQGERNGRAPGGAGGCARLAVLCFSWYFQLSLSYCSGSGLTHRHW